MCTAVTYKTKDHYFGRTLDFEFSYDETVTVTPRKYPFHFRLAGSFPTHYAMIGMAYVVEEEPLYYEATNEKGLSMAGLYFPGNACYGEALEGKCNVASFEFIPWILGQCADVPEAEQLLARTALVNLAFSKELPPSPLHWMIADRSRAITVEAVREGLNVYENPAGILTNNPPFDYHMIHLNQYMGLSAKEAENRFSDRLRLTACSKGMGALGLPGDSSSASRFVRAAFMRLNSVSGDSEEESVSQFFHIMGSVDVLRGCVRAADGQCESTIYTSCCNTDRGIYYYTTYGNHQISAVDMRRENLDGCRLLSWPLIKNQQIRMQN